MKQLPNLLDTYSLKYDYVSEFDIIKIYIENIKADFSCLKRLLKILVFKAQYKQIKKHRIVFEISIETLLSDEILTLLNIMKLTKTLHYFKIKVERNANTDLNVSIDDRLALLVKNYSGLSIK